MVMTKLYGCAGTFVLTVRVWDELATPELGTISVPPVIVIVPGAGDGVTVPCTKETVTGELLVFSMQKRAPWVPGEEIVPEKAIAVAFVDPSV
jgi:hypothetical protein